MLGEEQKRCKTFKGLARFDKVIHERVASGENMWNIIQQCCLLERRIAGSRALISQLYGSVATYIK